MKSKQDEDREALRGEYPFWVDLIFNALHVNDNVYDWLKDNVGHDAWIVMTNTRLDALGIRRQVHYAFKNEDDALAFRLRFPRDR